MSNYQFLKEDCSIKLVKGSLAAQEERLIGRVFIKRENKKESVNKRSEVSEFHNLNSIRSPFFLQANDIKLYSPLFQCFNSHFVFMCFE
jgi:hypothetical protein